MRRNDVEMDENRTNDVETSPTPTGDGGSRKPKKSKLGKVINSRYVRLRKSPSTSAQIVTVMSCGDEAVILDRVPGFYKVKTEKGNVGYVASTYFEEV